uniref:RNA binding protein (Nil per os homologue), putative n=1 Tax=Theileria annulata TaxID=5874 RepID=A0A3B0N2Z2_THEAN
MSTLWRKIHVPGRLNVYKFEKVYREGPATVVRNLNKLPSPDKIRNSVQKVTFLEVMYKITYSVYLILLFLLIPFKESQLIKKFGKIGTLKMNKDPKLQKKNLLEKVKTSSKKPKTKQNKNKPAQKKGNESRNANVVTTNSLTNHNKKVKENPEKNTKNANVVKLKFKNFSGTLNDFKTLLDSNVKNLGGYKSVNYKQNKIVVSFDDNQSLDRYLSFYNKFIYNDEALKVSVLDYFSTVKSDYKVLNLYGVPNEYSLESVQKGIKRRIEVEFKIKTEDDHYKLTFKNVPDCVKANSILNNARIPLVKDKKESLVKVNTAMELFGKATRNSSRVFVRNIPFKTTYEELASFFKEYDKGAKVHIPSKSKGYAFVNFSSLEKSKKLINELNGKMFKKRKIQLSLSLPKQLYLSKSTPENTSETNTNTNTDDTNVTNPVDTSADEEVSEEAVPEKDEIRNTIFVRNLDYECTEKELFEYFSKFAEVESCNICLNEDKSSKGTAFVKFKNKDQFKQLVENEKLSNMRDKELNNKKPVLGLGYTLRGRRLKLDLALPKEEAKILKEKKAEEDRNRLKEQKNLHLLMVGVIKEDSPQFNQLSDDQKETIKQTVASKMEKIKLKNTFVNPKMVNSVLGICIKNLPSNVKSNDLRAVIYNHLKTSLSESEYLNLKKLKNRGIVELTLLKGDSYTKDDQGVKVKKKKPFAFVQLVDHNIAMKTLEFFSNNKTLYPPKTLQCEFTIDTVKQARKPKPKNSQKSKNKTYSRGKRQREKRRLMKLKT